MLKRDDLDHNTVPQLDRNARAFDLDAIPFALVSPGEDCSSETSGSAICDRVAANLAAYQDGELAPDAARAVSAHLNECAECAAGLGSLQDLDSSLLREWRESAPLPSSVAFRQSIDAIMDALPPVPDSAPRFAPKRVHARTRWMRFATGLFGIFAFFGMLIYSYLIGYANGRKSLGMPSSPILPSQQDRYSAPTPRLTPVTVSQNLPTLPRCLTFYPCSPLPSHHTLWSQL